MGTPDFANIARNKASDKKTRIQKPITFKKKNEVYHHTPYH